jgi:23S rRNA (pseudouridine1915-N3)-methyltransferase
MHMRLIAVGDRQPPWVDAAFDDYALRLPKAWQFSLLAIPVPRRGRGSGGRAAMAAEEQKILAAIRPQEQIVLLDERGEQPGSRQFSDRLQRWQAGGQDLGFIIGGPDGVSDAVRSRADFCWSLSKLTLPHGLARVLFIEQLYRAWSIETGHPYHRE